MKVLIVCVWILDENIFNQFDLMKKLFQIHENANSIESKKLR